MAAEVRGSGHGGVRAVARAAGVSEATVRKGVFGLEEGQSLLGRVRRPGGGCKRDADLRFQESGPLLAAGGGTSAGARPRLRRPAVWARPSLTASMTWRRIPAGSMSAPTTTTPRSRWSAFVAGGTIRARPIAHVHGSSRSVTCRRRALRSGTRSSTGSFPTSRPGSRSCPTTRPGPAEPLCQPARLAHCVPDVVE